MINHNRNAFIRSFTRALQPRFASMALACALSFGSAVSVHAQYGGRGGMATLFVPDYLPRDLPVFVDALQLEEWQRPILEALLEDYSTSFTTAADGVRARMSGLKDAAAGTSADKVIDLVSQPLLDWANEKAKLRQEFLENVKTQLGDGQSELWPRFERAMRREKSLPNGELSGESLNLFFVMREMDLPPSAADAARLAVEEYEVALDTALVAREAALESTVGSLLKAMSSSDAQSGIQVQEQIMARRVAVRNAQDAGIAAIRDALGAEFGPAFEKRALQRAFPQVYRPDPVMPLIEAAETLPDLSAEQKASLEALKSRFTQDFSGLQARMADGYRQTEPGEPRRKTELAAQKAAGGTIRYAEAPAIEALKKERDDMFARYREEISAILNDAQKQAIPGMTKEGFDDGQSMPVGADANVVGPGRGAEPNPPSAKRNGLRPEELETAEPNVAPKGGAVSPNNSNSPKSPKAPSGPKKE